MTDFTEWLTPKVEGEPLTWTMLLVRIVLSLACGFLITGLHWLTVGRNRKETRGLSVTLVLLAGLVAVGTLVIGTNTARAFGLVGALSIVRFRTVVEDTSDTAYVIFSVTIGMAVGAGYLLLTALALPTLSVAALILSWRTLRPPIGRGYQLKVRLALTHEPEAALLPKLREFAKDIQLVQVDTGNKGTALDYVYTFKMPNSNGLVSLILAINKLEGIQSAEVKQ